MRKRGKQKGRRRVRGSGKWSKYQVMRKSKKLSAATPQTKRLAPQSLTQFLARYHAVIVKPSGGSGGAGVIQISRTGKGYVIQSGRRRTAHRNRSDVLAALRRRIRFSGYIIQRRIPLATVQGNPFDLRVMVQRPRRGGWIITGKLAKVAGKGYIVTNVARSGGKVLPVNTALRRSTIRSRSVASLNRSINQTALLAAKQLGHHYRSQRIVGLDMGICRQGKVWIIEANFRPAKSLFLKLKDKSMYRRILKMSH